LFLGRLALFTHVRWSKIKCAPHLSRVPRQPEIRRPIQVRATKQLIHLLPLTAAGVSKEDAQVYAEGIRRGGTLVTARVLDADRPKCEVILNRASVNLQERGTAYRKAGWKEFDANATPYTADQVRRERELYR
jgi:hypothetical protein